MQASEWSGEVLAPGLLQRLSHDYLVPPRLAASVDSAAIDRLLVVTRPKQHMIDRL